MNESTLFPGQSHLEHIKTTLWSGKPYGRSAVMIGAGFSRNAEPTKVNAKQFPSWKQLASAMYDELHPSAEPLDIERKERKNSAISGLGAIKVASEYEMWFGRDKLDSLLLTSIPYNSFRPGNLHEKLLSLPWSDVFTTNYDTLLEDTRPLVPDRDYELVLTARDIPRSKKPRIAKLHGSFPSIRPFIVTEEDYRTYPVKFAAFVNLVQQSLMENTFLLIGFSGDDPNFLNWLGWVRDNLREHTPLMYLCGVLNLSDSERKLLESRNVIPVDLSPIVPARDYPDSGQRNAKALAWFLDQLKLGEPPNLLNWPRTMRLHLMKERDSCSRTGNTDAEEVDKPDLISPRGSMDVDALKQRMKVWKQQRLGYPGWVVCPGKNRDLLWFHTRGWIFPIVESLDLLSPPENLLLLRELNWRLETALVPLPGIGEKLVSVVTALNPFPSLVKLDGSPITPEHTSCGIGDWDDIGEAWLGVVFSLIRNAREGCDPVTFRRWMDLIKDLVQRKPSWLPRYWHEECLYHLIRLDRKKVLETLEYWPTTFDSSVWQLRRAAIMAEVGQVVEAERLVEEALEQIRRSRDSRVDDYCVLSQEGWARLQASLLATNRIWTPSAGVDPHRGRWSELSAFRCDPWAEMEIMSAAIDGPLPVAPPKREEKVREGERGVTYHVSHPSLFELRLPAFAFLRQFEKGGLPISCGLFGIAGTATVNASKWIAPFSPVLAVSYIVRNGDKDSVEQWFDFTKASALSDDEVHEAAGLLMESLTQELAAVRKDPQQAGRMASFASRVIVTAPRLLGELCFRFSPIDREKLFKLTLDIYHHPVFGSGIGLQASVRHLVRRLIEAMTEEEILAKMPTLIALPIPEDRNFRVEFPRLWVEPLESISPRFFTGLPEKLDRSSWQRPIMNLVETVERGSNFARTRAATRLEALYEIGGLTPEQRDTFANALWSQRDSLSGLPAEFFFPNYQFLSLPEPTEGVAKAAFRQWIIGLEFPRILVEGDGSRGTGRSVNGKSIVRNNIIDHMRMATVDPAIRDAEASEKLVDWSAEEAAQILSRAAKWWHDNKQDLQDPVVVHDPLTGDEFRDELSKLVPLLGEVILPRLSQANQEEREQALSVLSEMEQNGFSVSRTAPMTLFVDPGGYDMVLRKLRHGLVSSDSEEVDACIHGCILWFVHALDAILPSFPQELLHELVNIVAGRRRPGLDVAIERLSGILHWRPDQLSDEQIGAMCVGLDYLTKETELPIGGELDIDPNVHPSIPLTERRLYRQKTAALAYKIHGTLEERGLAIPQILLDWKQICQDDMFPEVRRSWPPGS